MLVELIRDKVRVELDVIDEFEEGQPESYRFTVFRQEKVWGDGGGQYDEWEPVYDGSYCTFIDADTPFDGLVVYAHKIMLAVYDAVVASESIKRTCEELSWLGGRKQS